MHGLGILELAGFFGSGTGSCPQIAQMRAEKVDQRKSAESAGNPYNRHSQRQNQKIPQSYLKQS